MSRIVALAIFPFGLSLALAGCRVAPKATPVSEEPPAMTAADATASVEKSTVGARFEKREVEIPMRDGVTLFTSIYIPRGHT
ncbi:MAG: hypothetical protein ACPHRO_11775, partial [Nannocystaceae bacterium]